MQRFALMCMFTLLLAGCAGDPETEPQLDVGNGQQVDLDDVETTAQTGGIGGVVVDPTIAPVGGVNVSLDGTDIAQVTGDNGVYKFSGVEPGLYFVSFTHPDYLPTQMSIEVKAGEVTTVRAIMQADPSPKPYHNTLTYDWFDSVGQPLVDFAWDLFRPGGVPAMCDACEWTFESDMPVQTFVLEASWEDSIAPPHKASEFYWTMEPTEDTSDYESDYFAHPGLARIDNNNWGEHTEFFLMMAYEEEWVAVDQKAEVFISMFYIDPAPAGFSVVADS